MQRSEGSERGTSLLILQNCRGEKTAIGTVRLDTLGTVQHAQSRRFLRAFVDASLLVQNVQYVQGEIPF